MPLATLALALKATAAPLLLGVSLAARDSVKPPADSAEARPSAIEVALAAVGDEARARRMARATNAAATAATAASAARAAKPDLAEEPVDARLDPARHPEWAPGRRVLRAPGFRRLVNGRLLADSVVVEKGLRKLTLFYRGDSVASYWVALGRNPVGAKVQKGDGRTPEGVYRIAGHNPASKYHRALRVSYPSAADLARAQRLGVTTGGDIMIHGLPPAFAYFGAQHRAWDWTEGCIAVTDGEIEEIYGAVRDGAAIQIKP